LAKRWARIGETVGMSWWSGDYKKLACENAARYIEKYKTIYQYYQ
jgi:hypothetical protein